MNEDDKNPLKVDSGKNKTVETEGAIIMSIKGKIPPELKIQAVEDYLAIRKGSTEIIKELGIRRSTFQSWVRKYQMEGRSGLYPKKRFTSYPSSLKLAAVEDYLGGGGSLDAMCRKYGISSHAVLQQWITLYNQGHREFKTRRAREETDMAEKKKIRSPRQSLRLPWTPFESLLGGQ